MFLLNILAKLLPSQTWGIAVQLIPIFGRAFDLSKADDWIYDKLPEDIKEKGSLDEFDKVLKAGKAFMQAVYNFLHK